MCVLWSPPPKFRCFLCFEGDVMYSTVAWKPWRQQREMRAFWDSVGSSPSSQSLGSLEDLGLGSRMTGECLWDGKKPHCSRLTGQLKFNMSSSLCQPARHLDCLYGCSGVCSVHSLQQDVIKGTAAKSKPTVRWQWAAGALVLPPPQFDSSTWNKKSSHIPSSMITWPQAVLRIESPWHRLIIKSAEEAVQ